jgi:hypothetical protein
MTQQMNRADRAEQIAYLEALAAEATAAAAVHRAALESEAGDEYRRQKTRPSWEVPGFGTIAGKVRHSVVRVANPDDFLAWMKAHRPEDVEVVPATEQVRPATTKAILKGCKANDDGVIVTAGGDEIAGVEIIPGGEFEGIACTFKAETKAAYRELARTALARISLTPESAAQPAGDAKVDEDQGAAAAAAPDPWSAPAEPDPWATPEPAGDPWATTPA